MYSESGDDDDDDDDDDDELMNRQMRWQWQGLIIDRLAKFLSKFIPETSAVCTHPNAFGVSRAT